MKRQARGFVRGASGQVDPAEAEPAPISGDVASEEDKGASPPRARKVALPLLLVATFLAAAWVASPLWAGLVLGTTTAFALEPLHQRLMAKKMAVRPAALLLTAGTALICVGIGVAIGSLLVGELVALGESIQRYLTHGDLSILLGERGLAILERLGFDRGVLDAKLHAELSAGAAFAATMAGAILNSAAHAGVALVIAAITMYYVLAEWRAIRDRLERLSPLEPKHTRALLHECREVGRTALVGTLATAVVQGFLGGIGYAIVDVPQPVIWAVLTAIASLLPVIGTGLVWGPLAAMLFLVDRTGAGVFLVVWGLLVVMALSDYVIRPRLVDTRHKGQPLLVLVALIGGLEVMGPIGLFMGPVLMALFQAVLRMYERQKAAADAPAPAAGPFRPDHPDAHLPAE